MKVLHVTIADPAGVAIHNALAMMETYPEIEVRVIRSVDNYINYPKDLDYKEENIKDWIGWADLLHIHESGYYIMGKGYIPDKPVLMHFHNRMYKWHFKEWNKLCNSHNYLRVVSTPNLTLLNNDSWLPSARPLYTRQSQSSFSICQAPTNREVKGTEEVIKAAKEAGILLDVIEKVSWRESIDRKSKSSLMIGQFELGYGLNTIEAWALNLPVIGNAEPEILERIKELIGYIPFYPSTLQNLSQNLLRFRDDPILYKEYQERGRKTYQNLHSYQAVADSTLKLYDKILHKKNHYIPFKPEVEISVIIPCYNYSSYLPDLVQCLDRQTFRNWQGIIVNDADPDFTIPEWIKKHPKIKIVNLLENKGIAGAINKGIEASTGKYLTVLSADDLMRCNRLEILYNTLLDHPHKFIYDDLTIFGPGKARIRGVVTDSKGDSVLTLPAYNFNTILYKNGIHAGSLYPRSAWIQSGGYPEVAKEGREDHAYNIAMSLKGYCGIHVNHPLYLYRRHSANRTNFDSNPEWQQIYKQRLLNLYPQLYEGELPMGCCGGKKGRNGTGGIVAMTRSLPGSKSGMTKVQYTGGSSDSTWWVNQTRYVFGSNQNLGFVANEDLNTLLNMGENGVKVFQLYQEEAPKIEASLKVESVKSEFSKAESKPKPKRTRRKKKVEKVESA